MTPEVQAAVTQSIAHWERMRDNPWKCKQDGEVPSMPHCPLCRLFYMANGSCDGCPIKAATAVEFCVGSPYVEADLAWHLLFAGQITETEFRAAAQTMIDFLGGLQ